MTTETGTIGRYLGWFLAALSVAAGVIHFAVAGGHFDVTWYHGTFFAIAAWAQLSWAAAIVVRPSRALLALGVAGNAAIIATWAVSRTVGMPFGPESGEAESVSLADGLSTGFELAIVALALVVLLRPAFAQRSVAPRLGFAGLGATGVAIAVVSTVALTPSFASDHHGDGGGHGDTAAAEGTAGHGHDDDAMPADHGDMTAEEHAATEGEDGAGHTDDHGAAVISADGSSECEKTGFGSEGQSSHGHRGPAQYTPLSPEERAVFEGQVQQANQVIADNPTVADAEAHGYTFITTYFPCIGAHYLKGPAFGNGFDPAEPEVILFGGTEPDSEVVGLSYLEYADPSDMPEGFAGDNDTFHLHDSLCISPTAGVVGEDTTEEECEARGGEVSDTSALWMLHMWNAPAWPSAWGLFSGEHPDLGGTIGNVDGER